MQSESERHSGMIPTATGASHAGISIVQELFGLVRRNLSEAQRRKDAARGETLGLLYFFRVHSRDFSSISSADSTGWSFTKSVLATRHDWSADRSLAPSATALVAFDFANYMMA
jgi:hypothetical protein